MQTEILIRERAYAIWQQEGCPQGREWDHWLRAANEVEGATPAQPQLAAQPRKPAGRGKSAKARK